MTTIRFLFILFALLNVLLFAAARNWLDLGSSEGTGRIAVELHPEHIKVLGPTPPPDATPAPSVAARPPENGAAQAACLAWSGLTAAQNSKLISLFSAAGIRATAKDVQVAAAWRVVRLPTMLTHEAAEILADNMIVLGVERSSIKIEETEDSKFLIVLSEPSRNKRDTERHLASVKAKGVDASIEPLNAAERRVEAAVSKEKAETVLKGQPFAKRHKPCSA
ncbi:MAG: hypothetical protein LBU76_03025 [Azoarcus sp.]|jgi:hypothetical protein|nr:hypothetical protein [Azoarcus sp.]